MPKDTKQDELSPPNSDENNISEESLEELLSGIPEPQRKMVSQLMISSSFQMMRSTPENEVMKKISPEHITDYLQGAREDMQNSYKDKKQNKIFIFATILCSMVFFIILILILKGDPETMEKIITGLIGLIAGAVGGYGIGKRNSE